LIAQDIAGYPVSGFPVVERIGVIQSDKISAFSGNFKILLDKSPDFVSIGQFRQGRQPFLFVLGDKRGQFFIYQKLYVFQEANITILVCRILGQQDGQGLFLPPSPIMARVSSRVKSAAFFPDFSASSSLRVIPSTKCGKLSEPCAFCTELL
jgi:hypothetical protein